MCSAHWDKNKNTSGRVNCQEDCRQQTADGALLVYLQTMDRDAYDRQVESGFAPVWLWRTAVVTLVSVFIIGSGAAVWLGTRPVVTGGRLAVDTLGAWTLDPGASGQESDGRFTLRARQANQVVLATSASSLTDFVVEVRAAPLSGPDDAGYGLVVRHRGPDEFVALLIGADGYIAVGQMSDGEWRWRVPWQEWPHIQRGLTENRLRAECRADRCRFYVNDEFAFEVGAVPAEGQVGPAVSSPEADRFAAAFWDWRVWK